MFSKESPHQGNSKEDIQYTIYDIKKKKITLNYPKSAVMGFFPRDPRIQNEFETAVVNKPSVFEPLKIYCTCNSNEQSQYTFYGEIWNITLKLSELTLLIWRTVIWDLFPVTT